MGQGAQACQAEHGGSQRIRFEDYQTPSAGKTRRRARKRKKKEPIPQLGEAFAKNLTHFFPGFSSWLAELSDGRCQGKTVYPKEFCIWSGLAIFMQALGSRRQFDYEAEADLDSGTLLANLNALAGTQAEAIPHGDTLADYLSVLP